MAGRDAGQCLADLADVIWRGAAAAAGGIQEATGGELAQQPTRNRRILIETPERVGQACIRVTRDVDRRHARKRLDVRAHLGRAQRAVDAGGKGVGVLDGVPPGFDGLAGEVAPASIDDRDRDEEGQLRRDLFDRRDRRLGVERIEDRLDQQEVDASVAQPARGHRVAVTKLVECDGAVRGIVDIGRKRKGDVGRAERARYEPVLVSVDDRPRQPRARDVDLVRQVLEPVVRLRDRGRCERVRGDQVGACLQVLTMDAADHVRSRQVEDVDVVLEQLGVVAEPLAAPVLFGQALFLQQHADRPVKDHDPLLEQPIETLANGGGCRGDGRHLDP